MGSKAGNIQLDSIPGYPFLNLENNRLLLPDSSALDDFFKKLYHFEKTGSGKIRILHWGDSHVQGGFWTEEVRKSFHTQFSCGTQERGFIFPYSLAQSNNPNNYQIRYNGLWKGCRSAFPEQNCSWGLSGFNASSTDDSLVIYLKAKSFDNEFYDFDHFKAFLEFDTSSYDLQLLADDAEVLATSYDSLSFCYDFKLSKNLDSVGVYLQRKNIISLKPWQKVKTKDSVIVHGFSLLNAKPGITYSEAGVNGGKIASFLSSEHLMSQLVEQEVDVLVLSLGTNDVYSLLYNDSAFQSQYETLLQILKVVFPKVEVILTTPGDANRFQNRNIAETQVVRQHVLELAQKYGYAVWDWHTIMGGQKSIEEWRNYKLCQYDRVHLNEDGYRLQGQLMFNAIATAYEEYKEPYLQKELLINHGINWEQFWAQFYRYLAKQPLLFSSPEFWVLFAAFLFLYMAVLNRSKIRSWYLLLFSLFFYYKTGGLYFVLLLFSTVLDFGVGDRIFKAKTQNFKRFWLFVSVLVNLSLLGFFKYSYFIVDSINYHFGTSFQAVNLFYWFSNEVFGTAFNISEIILPVGISFYTFQTMSYAIDIYRGKIQPLKSMVDFGFFVSFFPQLVAGPIVRAQEFIPQIHQSYQLNKAQFVKAFVLIAGGLVKKVIISDYIALNFVDKIFDAPLRYSGFENLLAVYAYALQIYCDFSAYSDIAIGLALLLGFSLPDNFNAPYLAQNITDFWRRWHMSLSRWLKDYLYISLGGNRKGKLRTLVNIMLTMLIGGLWHGASVRFIVWGALHGFALVLHKLRLQWFPKLSVNKNYFLKIFSWSLTFHFVAYCWVFFRANDWLRYEQMIEQISNAFYDGTTNEWINPAHYLEVIRGYKEVVLLLCLGFIFHFIPSSFEQKIQGFLQKIPLAIYPIFIALLCLLLFQFRSFELSPFIYFQF